MPRGAPVFFPVEDWFAAFVITVLVEAPLVVVLLARAEPSLPRRAALVVFANLASHPAVWFVFTQLLLVGTTEFVVAAEAWAFGVEALFYTTAVRGVTVRRAVGVSLVANAASFMIGHLVGQVLPQVL